MKSLKKALTLAEILIVLAIVAVVSSIVLPGMYQNIKNQANIAIVARTKYAIELGCQETISRYNDPANGRDYNVDKVLLTGDNWKTKIIQYAHAADSSGNTTLVSNNTYKMKNFKSSFTASSINDGTDKYIESTVVFQAAITPNKSTSYSFNLYNNCHMIPADRATRDLVQSGFKAN